MKTTRIATILVLCGATTLGAQRPSPGTVSVHREEGWTAVRLAKWALLGGAVGFGAYALHNSLIAERSYGQLHDTCDIDANKCAITGGHYADPGAETLYRTAVSADRRAQVGIYGGQISLLGSVGLFIYDLRNGHGPRDIPYPSKRAVGVGLRFGW